MAYFPFMIQLEGASCLVGGGGKVAARKVQMLVSFGAQVTVVAPKICEELQNLNSEQVTIIERPLQEDDILEKDVVVLATDDAAVNHHYSELCKEKRILVNVVDVKEDCGFYFPAIIRQDEVVVSVSTGGSSPVLAAKIKKEIQKNLRPDLGVIAGEMAKQREQVLETIPEEADRKAYFEKELEQKWKSR
mgnify:FL=1